MVEVGRTAFYSERWQRVGGVLHVEGGWYIEAVEPNTFPEGRHFGFPFMDQGSTQVVEDSWQNRYLAYCSGTSTLHEAIVDSNHKQFFANFLAIGPFAECVMWCDLGHFTSTIGTCFGTQPEWFFCQVRFEIAAGVFWWLQVKSKYSSRVGGVDPIHLYSTLVSHDGGIVHPGPPMTFYPMANGAYSILEWTCDLPMDFPIVGTITHLKLSFNFQLLQPGIQCFWFPTKPIPFQFEPPFV